MKTRIDRLDALFSEFVRKRAIQTVGGCQRCLTPKYNIQKEDGSVLPSWQQLQCSHFVGRSNHSLRYDVDNGYGLCGSCHIYLSSHPLEHIEFVKAQLGEERFALLEARKRIMYPKPDKQAITLYLKELIRILDSEAQE